MRIVLDTNILARTALDPTNMASQLLALALVPPHCIVLSTASLSELLRVLTYDRLRQVHGFTNDEIRRYIARIEQSCDLVVLDEDAIEDVVPHDPDDNIVIATAIAGRAEILCTLDRHLRHPDVVDYCAQHGIRVLSDVELLQVLREAAEEEGQ